MASPSMCEQHISTAGWRDPEYDVRGWFDEVDRHSLSSERWYVEVQAPEPNAGSPKADPALEQWFREKADTWRRQTGGYSVIRKKISHSAYREIIDKGWDVVPLILEEMRRKPGYWFSALRSITNENPVREGATFSQATEDWISWGIQHDLIT